SKLPLEARPRVPLKLLAEHEAGLGFGQLVAVGIERRNGAA
ncbi:MAG: hypothetical protein ACJA2W_003332, partial [Planctomycetota bacterium]